MHVPGCRGFSHGPATELNYIHVEYGHFHEYMAWVTSTWVPTMEALKKAGLIIGYKVFQAIHNYRVSTMYISRLLTKNMAACAGDIGDQANAFGSSDRKGNL